MINFGLPIRIGRIENAVVHGLRKMGVLKSGGRVLIPLEPRIPNKFIAPGLSRMELRDVGLFDNPAIPKFDAKGFEKNLENILNTVNDHRELTDRIADAVGTFIWRPDWTAMVVMHPLTGKEILVPGRKFPSLDQKDIDLARPNSVIDYALRNRHLVYVPNYRFDISVPFYYIQVPEALDEGILRPTSAQRENINVTPFILACEAASDRKEDVPVSVVVAPVLWMPEKKVLGYHINAYTEWDTFNASGRSMNRPGLEPHLLRYFHLLSEAASLKLLELQKQGKFPQ